MINTFDVVADLRREVVRRGSNQYADPLTACVLANHLAKYEGSGQPLFVGEAPATRAQAVAFTDNSRSSKVFNAALGAGKACRWNAWPFWMTERPNASEIRRGAEYAAQVAALTRARRVYAVGRIAEKCLGYAGIPCEYLPHPGQDKAPLFVKRMDEIMGRVNA